MVPRPQSDIHQKTLQNWSIDLGGTVNLKQGISLYSQTASTKLDSHHVYLWVLITAYELSFPL